MINKKIIAGFIFGVVVLSFFLANIYADVIQKPTGKEIVPLTRGENRGILMDPDTMYTLYYISDGKPATIQYSESFASYFFGKNNNGNSLIALSIYSAPWFDQKYSLVKNTQIWFLTDKTSLPKTSGLYKFEFKAYGHDWAAVNFKVY